MLSNIVKDDPVSRAGSQRRSSIATIRTAVVIGVFIAYAAAEAQSPAPGETGSISGVVRNAETGEPVAGVRVLVVARGQPPSATSDAEGRYTLTNVPPGRRRVLLAPMEPLDGDRFVTLRAGQDLRSIDLLVRPKSSVSGRVVDENGEPLPDVEVVLLGREYFLGGLRYYRRSASRTNDQGEYHITRRVTPGVAWLVWARHVNRDMEAVSDAPADPKLRRPAIIPTYYPSAASPEGAAFLTLRPGEQREGVDIRMLRSPSYCLEAHLDVQGQPGGMSFWIQEGQPSFGIGPSGATSGLPSEGKAGRNGKIRLCGLHRGEYRLTVFSGNLNFPDSFAATLVSIVDSDIKGITLVPRPGLPLAGEVVWAREPPEKPVEREISVRLQSLNRSAGGMPTARSSVPGEFALKTGNFLTGEEVDPIMDEYWVMVLRLSENLYLKDVTYGGTSVLHKPLLLGSAMAGARLRVILDHDGGLLRTHVSDSDGEPVSDANVIVFPKEAKSLPDLAATRIARQTDQNGDCVLPALAPGAYYVLATEAPVTDVSPETISKLFNARSKAEEVEIGPNATVQLTLKPVTLE